MKHFAFAVALAAVMYSASAADVGVSVSIGQPGFYGRIDIGTAPQPRLIYKEPILIQRVDLVRQPVYLHVPPGHAKKWRKHCRDYDACDRPVYFVQNDWYTNVYVPHHHANHSGGKSGGKHGDKGHGKGNRQD